MSLDQENKAQMDAVVNEINEKIESGEIPVVQATLEGEGTLPEGATPEFKKEHNPSDVDPETKTKYQEVIDEFAQGVEEGKYAVYDGTVWRCGEEVVEHGGFCHHETEKSVSHTDHTEF